MTNNKLQTIKEEAFLVATCIPPKDNKMNKKTLETCNLSINSIKKPRTQNKINNYVKDCCDQVQDFLREFGKKKEPGQRKLKNITKPKFNKATISRNIYEEKALQITPETLNIEITVDSYTKKGKIQEKVDTNPKYFINTKRKNDFHDEFQTFPTNLFKPFSYTKPVEDIPRENILKAETGSFSYNKVVQNIEFTVRMELKKILHQLMKKMRKRKKQTTLVALSRTSNVREPYKTLVRENDSIRRNEINRKLKSKRKQDLYYKFIKENKLQKKQTDSWANIKSTSGQYIWSYNKLAEAIKATVMMKLKMRCQRAPDAVKEQKILQKVQLIKDKVPTINLQMAKQASIFDNLALVKEMENPWCNKPIGRFVLKEKQTNSLEYDSAAEDILKKNQTSSFQNTASEGKQGSYFYNKYTKENILKNEHSQNIGSIEHILYKNTLPNVDNTFSVSYLHGNKEVIGNKSKDETNNTFERSFCLSNRIHHQPVSKEDKKISPHSFFETMPAFKGGGGISIVCKRITANRSNSKDVHQIPLRRSYHSVLRIKIFEKNSLLSDKSGICKHKQADTLLGKIKTKLKRQKGQSSKLFSTINLQLELSPSLVSTSKQSQKLPCILAFTKKKQNHAEATFSYKKSSLKIHQTEPNVDESAERIHRNILTSANVPTSTKTPKSIVSEPKPLNYLKGTLQDNGQLLGAGVSSKSSILFTFKLNQPTCNPPIKDGKYASENSSSHSETAVPKLESNDCSSQSLSNLLSNMQISEEKSETERPLKEKLSSDISEILHNDSCSTKSLSTTSFSSLSFQSDKENSNIEKLHYGKSESQTQDSQLSQSLISMNEMTDTKPSQLQYPLIENKSKTSESTVVLLDEFLARDEIPRENSQSIRSLKETLLSSKSKTNSCSSASALLENQNCQSKSQESRNSLCSQTTCYKIDSKSDLGKSSSKLFTMVKITEKKNNNSRSLKESILSSILQDKIYKLPTTSSSASSSLASSSLPDNEKYEVSNLDTDKMEDINAKSVRKSTTKKCIGLKGKLKNVENCSIPICNLGNKSGNKQSQSSSKLFSVVQITGEKNGAIGSLKENSLPNNSKHDGYSNIARLTTEVSSSSPIYDKEKSLNKKEYCNSPPGKLQNSKLSELLKSENINTGKKPFNNQFHIYQRAQSSESSFILPSELSSIKEVKSQSTATRRGKIKISDLSSSATSKSITGSRNYNESLPSKSSTTLKSKKQSCSLSSILKQGNSAQIINKRPTLESPTAGYTLQCKDLSTRQVVNSIKFSVVDIVEDKKQSNEQPSGSSSVSQSLCLSSRNNRKHSSQTKHTLKQTKADSNHIEEQVKKLKNAKNEKYYAKKDTDENKYKLTVKPLLLKDTTRISSKYYTQNVLISTDNRQNIKQEPNMDFLIQTPVRKRSVSTLNQLPKQTSIEQNTSFQLNKEKIKKQNARDRLKETSAISNEGTKRDELHVITDPVFQLVRKEEKKKCIQTQKHTRTKKSPISKNDFSDLQEKDLEKTCSIPTYNIKIITDKQNQTKDFQELVQPSSANSFIIKEMQALRCEIEKLKIILNQQNTLYSRANSFNKGVSNLPSTSKQLSNLSNVPIPNPNNCNYIARTRNCWDTFENTAICTSENKSFKFTNAFQRMRQYFTIKSTKSYETHQKVPFKLNK